jgi:hypothetical protein
MAMPRAEAPDAAAPAVSRARTSARARRAAECITNTAISWTIRKKAKVPANARSLVLDRNSGLGPVGS